MHLTDKNVLSTYYTLNSNSSSVPDPSSFTVSNRTCTAPWLRNDRLPVSSDPCINAPSESSHHSNSSEKGASFIMVNCILPKKILYNPPATIVFWNDDTKTVVKSKSGDEFSYYWGFVAAFAEKMIGSNHAVKKLIRKKCNLHLDKNLALIDEADSK